MSVGNSSSHSSTPKVVSEYFSSGMDESLSDFQEKKKFAAPKNIITKSKTKPKKTLKKPKGTKDIRTALKSKKSELVTYSEDFDNVCKQVGIDVDSEQLQLAIALSKSVQPQNSDTQSSEPSSQERAARIRSTLQDYGFTVPEIKISNNRRKKEKRNYKLLLLSEIEKHQNIAEKYSRVLLQNISHAHSPKKRIDQDCAQNLFYLTTNATYESVRDNKLYYLDNLAIEKSSKGNLLRDWSGIPGRPTSPKPVEDFTMDISEILCSQEELNIILSGPLKSAKHVIRSKLEIPLKSKKELNNSIYKIIEDQETEEIESLNSKSSVKVTDSARSCSPDMFDDDAPSFQNLEVNINDLDNPDDIVINNGDGNNLESNTSIILPSTSSTAHKLPSQGLSQKWNITRRKSNDIMELTECVGVNSNPSSSVLKTDTTKRKSNDFMDLTECVVKAQIEDINLSQNSDENVTENKEIDCMDLTQSSNSNEAVPSVHVSDKNNSLDDTVMLNDSEINIIHRSQEHEDVMIEESPKKIISIEESSNDTFFEDFMYNHSHSPNQNDSTKENIVTDENIDKIEIDLTQSPEKSYNERELSSLSNPDNSKVDLTQSPEKHDDNFKNSVLEKEDQTEFDLTQDLEEVSTNNVSSDKVMYKCSLGKKDNVSIDYDELSTTHLTSSLNKTNIYDLSDNMNPEEVKNNSFSTSNCNTANSSNQHSAMLEITPSQNSEVFEISDKELNYSMHKSRYEECFDVDSNDKSIVHINSFNTPFSYKDDGLSDNDKSTSDSFLPEVNIKQPEILKEPYSLELSPIRHNDNNGANHNDLAEVEFENHEKNKELSSKFLPEVNIRKPKRLQEPYSSELSPIRHSDNGANHNVLAEVEVENHDKHKESSSDLSPIRNKAKYDIIKTPSNSEYVVKTDEVTPIGDYNAMSTPDRNRELDKYGLKPLKRKRAIQLLTHIYNQTHPVVEPCPSEVTQSPTKKRKIDPPKRTTPRKSPENNLETNDVVNRKQLSPNKRKNAVSTIRSVDIDRVMIENIYEVTNERVEIRNIECGDEEWVFQKREKAKLQSCRVPLHIAFHNYVSSRRGLLEAILRYEPVEIDVIHKGLVADGYRYDPKELLKFLDKKCITVKTADHVAKNSRK